MGRVPRLAEYIRSLRPPVGRQGLLRLWLHLIALHNHYQWDDSIHIKTNSQPSMQEAHHNGRPIAAVRCWRQWKGGARPTARPGKAWDRQPWLRDSRRLLQPELPMSRMHHWEWLLVWNRPIRETGQGSASPKAESVHLHIAGFHALWRKRKLCKRNQRRQHCGQAHLRALIVLGITKIADLVLLSHISKYVSVHTSYSM